MAYYSTRISNKNYEKAAKGYKNLLEDSAPLVDIQYPSNQIYPFSTKDPFFQGVCLQYYIQNLIASQNTRDLPEAIKTLEKGSALLKGGQLFRPYLILAQAYLLNGSLENCKKYLDQLLSIGPQTILRQLEVIEVQIQYHLKAVVSSPDSAHQIIHLAKKYRELALNYYPKGFYANYQFLHYERLKKHSNLHYCKLLDFDKFQVLKEGSFLLKRTVMN